MSTTVTRSKSIDQQSPSEDAAASQEEGTARPSKDVIFELLKVRRRRLVLLYLDENDGVASVGTLAEHVGALENDKSEQALSSDERKRVYIALYQCHLPKMDDAGVIDYDQARGTVELTGAADCLFPYLDIDPVADATDTGGTLESVARMCRSALNALPTQP